MDFGISGVSLSLAQSFAGAAPGPMSCARKIKMACWAGIVLGVVVVVVVWKSGWECPMLRGGNERKARHVINSDQFLLTQTTCERKGGHRGKSAMIFRSATILLFF